jgi:hypothetical protein
MLFERKNFPKYFLMLGIILFASFVGKKYANYFEPNETKNEHELIQKYLLNESSIYGYNKPKIWIHTKYEYNSRVWKSFQSRSSHDLNQPYIHLTIKSIVLHCADDFNICLIDDDTFRKLIPSWTIDMNSTPEPLKTQCREYGMAQLVYYYGGMVVPNTFVCLRNLKDFYMEGIENNTPFVGEYENKNICSNAGGQTSTFAGDPNYIVGANRLAENAKMDLMTQSNNPALKKERQRLMFLPNAFFMGAKKNDPMMFEMMNYLKIGDTQRIHLSAESCVLGNYQQWCLGKVMEGKMKMMDGEWIGTKHATDKKPLLIEDMFAEGFLDIRPDCYGIYIPEMEILKRTKYQWFAVMNGEDILQSRLAIGKYLVESVVNHSPSVPRVVDNVRLDELKMKERTVFTI